MKRQGLKVSIGQLKSLVNELEKELLVKLGCNNQEFQINIINKTPECSDTWEIENPEKDCGCDTACRTFCEKHYNEMYGESDKE